MRGSDFIFDCVDLHYYKCHKTTFKFGCSYTDSQDQIKKIKVTTNLKNDDDNYFQYAATIVLNNEKVQSHPERVLNIKPFIKKCNWEGINYSSKVGDWEGFEKNNLTVVLNVLYIKEKEICSAYFSKIDLNCENN